jgi:hypothetical protein
MRGRFKSSVWKWGLGLLTVAAFTPAPASASWYSENFPNGSSAARLSAVGWSVNSGTTGTDVTETTPLTASGLGIVWNTAGKDGTNSYGFGASASSGALWWTQEFTPIPQSGVNSIEFYSNNSTTGDVYRIAIRLDNNTPGVSADDFWVATNSTYNRNSSTAGSSGNWVANGELESFAYSTAAAQWRDLTFVSGTSLSVAGTARVLDLPAGNINAAGLYGFGSSGFRFDQFAIVPEPTSAAILGACAMGLLATRRRRG